MAWNISFKVVSPWSYSLRYNKRSCPHCGGTKNIFGASCSVGCLILPLEVCYFAEEGSPQIEHNANMYGTMPRKAGRSAFRRSGFPMTNQKSVARNIFGRARTPVMRSVTMPSRWTLLSSSHMITFYKLYLLTCEWVTCFEFLSPSKLRHWMTQKAEEMGIMFWHSHMLIWTEQTLVHNVFEWHYTYVY